MKKTDIALLIIIVSVSALFAFLVANWVMGDPSEKKEDVFVAEAITTEITPPDPNVFNNEAINPAVRVEIDGEPEGDVPSESGDSIPTEVNE